MEDQEMNSDEEELVVCDTCGVINGCEHYYIQDNAERNLQTDDFTEETISELLISFVSLRPPLWDHRLPLSQRTKSIKDQLWVEILSEFGGNTDLTPAILQKKWKNLRDKYIKTKAELDTYTPSGSAAKKKKEIWKHFDAMAFLRDTVAPRTTISSHSTESVCLFSPPSTSNEGFEVTPSKRKNKTGNEEQIASSILQAVEKVCTTESTNVQLNPICQRISELLEKIPAREKTELEIKLLTITYDAAKQYM
ncbi:unnamed protein product [Psylliodes chrysocephalus]|uniref:MADF domain-containing protein n=1 Tax=Psylliodes chrysocephalus TaxID=3402493 RepID=A0A9P0D468_9CUCU|nr:unnamed protein product [Psylliodes chrysocephala]